MSGSSRCIYSSDDVVIKSPNDRRLYRVIELENGLCALLVHDPDVLPEGSAAIDDSCEERGTDDDEHDGEDSHEETADSDDEDEEDECDNSEEEGKKEGGSSKAKKAAAAMCVAMGSFSDPKEAQGLAHFLEHMLFMGSADFPDENEYDSYLSKHGGSSNAYTETERTCYYFDVKREFLHGALRRFSQFFVSPLMKDDAMEREVLAVDSEFNQVLQSDACRLQQLQCHTAETCQPYNKFFCGNKKSLVDAMTKGINMRECIMKLYNDYYHGGLMKLVIIGGESLDVLESWVLELFANVRKGPRCRPEFRTEGPIWKSGRLYKLEAVKDIHLLDLTWTLPSLRQDYLKKSEDYLAHLLGHEGSGSLHSLLKAKGWATSLSAGVGEEGIHRSSLAYIFTLSIHLTDSGLEKVLDIIGFVYQYLKLLREVSPQEWIFKELQNIGNMEFKFAEDQPQDDYAVELAENLLVYPVEHVIFGDYVYKIWDQEMLKRILGFITPENMRVDVVSKSFQLSDFECEPWFGTHYVKEDIPQSLMEIWRDPPEIDPSLHLPAKNEFIPSDFSLRSEKAAGIFGKLSPPKCLIDEPLLKLWYKQDETFKVPRANAYLRINLKEGYNSVKNCLLTELFVNHLKDDLNEIIYQASIAKLETSVSILGDKLEFRVCGFSDKLPVLLSKILARAKAFLPTADRFKVIKENMERSFRNANMKPLNHSSYARVQALCKSFYDTDEKLCCLNELSLSDLTAIIPTLRSQVYVEGLCHGNFSGDEAVNISNIIKSNFPVEPLPEKLRHEERVMCLPPAANVVRDVRVKNRSENNSVVELYFQIEPETGSNSTRLKALVDLFDEIVEEPLFNQLRTKEQLGYVVDCGPRLTYRVHGFCFRVQSSAYGPDYLLGRVDNFISGLEELLEKIDQATFESYKGGLVSRLLEKDPSLVYETNRLWGQITEKRYMFDASIKEAEEVRSIEKKEVIEWYKTYLKFSSDKCRRLAVKVWGCEREMKEAESYPSNVRVIEDVGAFKSSAHFYPSLM